MGKHLILSDVTICILRWFDLHVRRCYTIQRFVKPISKQIAGQFSQIGKLANRIIETRYRSRNDRTVNVIAEFENRNENVF